MSFDPAELAKRFRDDGLAWAEKNCSADLLEETRKSLRAQIAVSLFPTAGSAAKAELMAEASKEYIDHIKLMVDARRDSNRAKVQYDADRAFIDLVRSQESSRRAEMNLR